MGVPFTLKDCMEVQGLICTAGIINRRELRSESDATVVARCVQSIVYDFLLEKNVDFVSFMRLVGLSVVLIMFITLTCIFSSSKMHNKG